MVDRFPRYPALGDALGRGADDFSGVSIRLLGESVTVFLQALLRHLFVPERLVPKRMTVSRSWQRGQAIAIMPTVFPTRYALKSNAVPRCGIARQEG
jgi:hypothetical protein